MCSGNAVCIQKTIGESMKYGNIIKGSFIERINRFVAIVNICGKGNVKVHVKNTGRCKELFVKDAAVYLENFEGRMGTRKMQYSLICVEKRTINGRMLVNVDSQAPNKAVYEALRNGKICLPGLKGKLTSLRPEKRFEASRFDFYAETSEEEKAYIEVKGVTLEENGVVMFPDAPTERGVKHVNELIRASQSGFGAYIIFVIQIKGVLYFTPNDSTQREFGEALKNAAANGVHILAYDCFVGKDCMEINEFVEVRL